MENFRRKFSALEARQRDSNPMKVVIVHGYQGEPMGGWRPWMKRELEARGFDVSVPAMPSPDSPKVGEWVATIAKETDGKGKECILVGHSLGCAAILRYLERDGNGAAGALLVAGFAGKLGSDFAATDNFVETPLDAKKVKAACPRMVAIFSDNDPYVPLSQEKVFREKLGAKTLVLHARGHFSSSDGCTELPEALEMLLEMAR